MTFEMIFTPCGRAVRFVDYVTLELTNVQPRAQQNRENDRDSDSTTGREYHFKGREPSERMLCAVYTRFNTLPPSLYTLAIVPLLELP